MRGVGWEKVVDTHTWRVKVCAGILAVCTGAMVDRPPPPTISATRPTTWSGNQPLLITFMGNFSAAKT
uniref:Uncharacterized protein n=1 Tax=Physcomitrium patens TaxID=3218 RepID=A0A2K1IY33_PHYPA|nr:hypothetical protein PHYPA_024002 [Physcomitrium patens]